MEAVGQRDSISDKYSPESVDKLDKRVKHSWQIQSNDGHLQSTGTERQKRVRALITSWRLSRTCQPSSTPGQYYNLDGMGEIFFSQ